MSSFTVEDKEYPWEKNMDIARRAHDRATIDGWFVVCPHLLSAHDKLGELCSYEEYLRRDLEFIRMVRPDIILLPRWMFSLGGKQEYRLALELGLNLYSYGELNDQVYTFVEGVV